MLVTCDVLVIGGGPSGSTAARFAARKGIKVILLEKRKELGVPVQCAGYVPWQITQEVELPEAVISQRVYSMRTYISDGEVIKTKANGFIIHRDLFDKALIKEAIKEGTELLLDVKAIGYEDGLVWTNKGLKIKARVIIGADGPHSTVGKWIGQSNTDFIHTAQYQMKLSNELSSTEVYFRRDIPGGYGWVFPKGKTANVGCGVCLKFGVKPITALHSFVEYLQGEGIIEPPVLDRTGGAIPVSGLINRLHLNNMLLVGDAGGMAHPITGAGVLNAVLAGKIAGEVAAKAVLKNNLDILTEYEEECRMLLDEPLMKARQKRKAMETHWNDGNKELTKALRSSWIAFEEYTIPK